jgi:lysylphosphatidylglycerol synthetase-like protein (DUF2156 family)
MRALARALPRSLSQGLYLMIDNTILVGLSTQERIAYIIADYIYQLLQTHGSGLILLALIGIFTLLRACLDIGLRAFSLMLRLLIITPIIVISTLLSLRKNPEKRKELTDILYFMRHNPHVLHAAIMWAGIIVLVVVIYLVLWNAILGINPITEISNAITDVVNASNTSNATVVLTV